MFSVKKKKEQQKRKRQTCEVMDVSISLMVGILSQCICITKSSHRIFWRSQNSICYTSIKLEKNWLLLAKSNHLFFPGTVFFFPLYFKISVDSQEEAKSSRESPHESFIQCSSCRNILWNEIVCHLGKGNWDFTILNAAV